MPWLFWVVNLSVLTTGMGLAWSSPMLVKLTDEEETPLNRTITEEEGSWIVSIGSLASILSNFLVGVLMDSIGRKYCILLTCVPKLIIALLFIFATDIWMLILGRTVNGAIDSFLFIAVPVYASEIASKEMRGSLCTFLQIFSSLGIVVTLSVGPFVSYVTFNTIFAVVILVTSVPLLFLPDTPFFLHSKGKTDKALEVLTYLRDSEQLAKEEIATYAQTENDEKIDKISIFKDRVVLKSFAITIVFCACTQLVGFNAVSFYLQTILVSTNSNVSPEIASVVIGMIQLLASFCTTILGDKFKRKQILITSLIGMFFGMVGLGVFFKIKEDVEVFGFLNYLPLISLILVVYSYSAGIGSLMWVLIAELFDGPARAIGVTTSLMVTTIFIFITTKYFSFLTLSIGPAITYWMFSGMCILTCIFIYFCVPETKGKSFSEIQTELRGEKQTKGDAEKS
ncbi:facilitated trehalose transporter Tret1-like isoform X2 [Battus philenor]|uniref:facilitated trehalose transporter Tret1-like isoform X2 n=1 Tax=Battus philenor TaxID=42288 RepID=UPI0035D12E94